MSACFLLLHVCDVLQFRDDHARMRINGPLASLVRLRRRRNRVKLARMSYLQAIFVNIATRFWRWKFRIRNSYPTDRMSSILHISNDGCLNFIVVCCVFRLLSFVIFYFRSVISYSARARQMTRGVTSRLDDRGDRSNHMKSASLVETPACPVYFSFTPSRKSWSLLFSRQMFWNRSRSTQHFR